MRDESVGAVAYGPIRPARGSLVKSHAREPKAIKWASSGNNEVLRARAACDND